LLKDGFNDVSYAIIFQGSPDLDAKCLLLAPVIDVESFKKGLRGHPSDILGGKIDSYSINKLLL